MVAGSLSVDRPLSRVTTQTLDKAMFRRPTSCSPQELGDRLGRSGRLLVSAPRIALRRTTNKATLWHVRASQPHVNAGAVAPERGSSKPDTPTANNAAKDVASHLEASFPKPTFELTEDDLDPTEAIMLQGFGWTSCEKGGKWYNILLEKVPEIKATGFTHVWLPPPSRSVSKQGYLPDELYQLDTAYGTKEELVELNQKLRAAGVRPMADIVINHRSAASKGPDGKWNNYTDTVPHPGAKVDWGPWAITGNDPDFGGTGAADTGADYNPAPDVDHKNEVVRQGYKDWLLWLKDYVGFMSWRLDFVKGYAPCFVVEYVTESVGEGRLNVGENWVDMKWDGSFLCYEQDCARQQMCDWIDATGGASGLFDFPTKGILQEAVKREEYDRLSDSQGKPPGLIGWWPAKAVTFVDNHDTGGSQSHWPFPKHNLDLGYAYILTHPGVPCILYEHYFDNGTGDVIKSLIALRKRNGITARSKVKILCADKDMYVACINDSVVLKLGPRHDMGCHLPRRDNGWVFGGSGQNWAVWEKNPV